MARKYFWTEGQDTQIRRRRCEGASWETIAAELSLNLRAVTERGYHLGAERLPAGFSSSPPDPARDPLPPGHPICWDSINMGTVLEGEPYPLRVFRL